MEESKSPGISIDQVILTECHLGGVDLAAALEYNLVLVRKERILGKDEKKLSYLLAFDLMQGMEKPPIRFTFAFLVQYSRDEKANMKWAEFTDAHALTHVLPFIREFVVNMTSRTIIPKLIIPPLNVYALLKAYEQAAAHGSHEQPKASQVRSAHP
jgi:hypothetical protein